ncbi:MAG: branched chain amino acid aminotransferase [Candidatus Melainabacteria bacterium HGW-Melainabacteria-1]|nr:MAG: branched chain amino acid aminotransferase [Candidatus Melainabacteria bacterium HGW-Melainabacteria-1]
MFPENGKIWSNGKLIPWQDAKIHVMAHGLHYGSGIFEGIRCYNGADGPVVFRLDDHLHRFLDSAKVYRFKVPFSFDELKAGVLDAIRANNYQDCYIRPIAFVGYGRLGVFPDRDNIEVHIGAWPWGAYLGDEGLQKGARVTITSWKKFQSQMFPVMAKATGQYLNSMLAVMDARDRGYDEALMLNEYGDLAEGSGENVFLVKRGKLFTNPITASILAGITRDTILQIAGDLGYEIDIMDMTIGQIFTADEAFFTGTAVEVTPIREVDMREIGSNSHWPVTRHLQETYFRIVKGEEPKYKHWLTSVYK